MPEEPQHYTDQQALDDNYDPSYDVDTLIDYPSVWLRELADKCSMPTIDEDCLACRASAALITVLGTDAPEGTVIEDPGPIDTPSVTTNEFVIEVDAEIPAEQIVGHLDALRELVLPLFDPAAAARLRGLTPGEFASLVIAAKQWLAVIDAQLTAGFHLNEAQHEVRAEVKRVVEKVRG